MNYSQNIYELQRKIKNLIVGKPGRHPLTQVTRISPTTNEPVKYYLIRAQQPSEICLPKMHTLHLNHEETSDKPNRGTVDKKLIIIILTNRSITIIFKCIKVIKIKLGMGNCPRMETKKTRPEQQIFLDWILFV